MSSAIVNRRGPKRPESTFDKLTWRGWTVRGNRGETIGTIEEIYIADGTAAPEWALVRGDGPGGASSFLPLQGSKSEGNEVIVPFSRTQVTHAPPAEESSRLSPEQGAALYDYYSISNADHHSDSARVDSAWEMVAATEQKLTAQLSRVWRQWTSSARGDDGAARSTTAPSKRQRRSAQVKPLQGEQHEDDEQR